MRKAICTMGKLRNKFCKNPSGKNETRYNTPLFPEQFYKNPLFGLPLIAKRCAGNDVGYKN